VSCLARDKVDPDDWLRIYIATAYTAAYVVGWFDMTVQALKDLLERYQWPFETDRT
jgi:hypothetical protein